MATTKSRSGRKTVQAVVTVCKFTQSNQPFTIVRPETSLKEFADIHTGDYAAHGFDTPLRDATARFIDHLESLQGPDKVVIGLMADESGSMHGNEGAVIQGINDFVKGMAEVKKVDPATAGNVLAVITTDGHENASREVSPAALRDRIAKKEAEGWTFIFLGAQIDAWRAGSSLGLSGGVTGQMVSTPSSPRGMSNAMRAVTTDASSYLASNAAYTTAKVNSGTSMSSITEDGQWTTGNTNAAPGVGTPNTGSLWTPGQTPGTAGPPPTNVTNVYVGNSPYANVEEALKEAKKKTS